jgi:hypothetical protein
MSVYLEVVHETEGYVKNGAGSLVIGSRVVGRFDLGYRK